ncbi:MAG: CreA family protein [Rhodospirillales bacterium]|nr:CreA family protein [Rhodospirillales bacterium]
MRFIAVTLCLLLFPIMGQADEIGRVSSNFKMIGPNDSIIVEAFDDPKIEGVACHLSRAVKGGISGGLGLAEDTSDASIACRQVGPIKINDKLKPGERVFKESTSLLFKTIQVVRFLDQKRNVLIYLVYSDKLIDGSPKNSISTVPVAKWAE